ncbi:MAG: M23 family metallopeptidase [Thermodesulfobacteriota bacterium]
MKTSHIVFFTGLSLVLACAGVYFDQANPSLDSNGEIQNGFQARRPHNGISPMEVQAVSPPPLPLSAKISQTIAGELLPGDTLMLAMKRAELPETVRHQIVNNLDSCLDFRRLRPHDTFTVDLDQDGNLLRCIYESDPLHKYTVVKRDDTFIAAQDEIPLEVKTVSITGTVNSSLFTAFQKLNLSPKLIYSFADIFSSRLDFNTETQPGDNFSIVYEEYYQKDTFIGYGNILYAKYGDKSGKDVQEGFYHTLQNGKSAHYSPNGEELGTSFLRSPVPMGRVTSRFSWRRKHPILGVVKPHLGVDLAAPTGTPIIAAADGKVVFRGVRGGFGKQVIIKHPNGYKTYYGHLSRFARGLHNGSKIKQKDIIGYVGSTGRSTGPHLDYRIAHNNQFKNPFALKFKPRSVLSGTELAYYNQSTNQLVAMLDKSTTQKILYVRTFVLKPQDSITLL